MTAEFTDDELVQLKAGLPRWGGFFRLATDPVVPLWLAVGKIQPGVDALDTVTGQTYRGLGELLDLPAFTAYCDGQADRYTFAISGIPQTVLGEVAPQMADQQIAVKDKLVSVGYGIMGSDWQLLGAVHWQSHGYADVLGLRIKFSDQADQPDTWALQLQAADVFAGRRRERSLYWTPQKHEAENPGDLFFDRVVLNTVTQKPWPPR